LARSRRHLPGLDLFCVDGELRADEATEAAVDAGVLFTFGHDRVVVALSVELGGLYQDVFGAELDAEVAAFAAAGDGVDLTTGNGELVEVEGPA
jgi:hypothetical protein